MPDPSLIQEPDFQQAATDLQESYKAQEGQKIPRAQVLPPKEATDPLVDATNIMFGDFGKALGFTLDQKHLRWNVETAKEAWTESPVKSAIEVGLNVAPIAFKAMQGMRAAKLAGVPEDALRVMDLIDETANVANMSEKTKDIAKLQAFQLQRKTDLQDKIASGLASPGEQAINFLDKKFGNSYMEAVDPKVSADYMKNWVDSFKTNIADNEKLQNLIVASSKVPDEYGVKFAQYFQNPDKLSEIPKEYHPVAMQLADEMRSVNSQMLKEGIVDTDEAKKVGPIWFSLVREGTPAMEAGAANVVLSADNKTGKTKLLAMPKTYSPSLLSRKMTNDEVGDLLIKKEASQLIEKGDTAGALSLLKDDKYNSATSLIKEGDSFGAMKLLNKDGKIDLSPKNLTNGSLATQKALLETYRLVRDTAMKYGKKGSEITPEMKSTWQSLDNLFGSDRLRRMVGISKGLDKPVDELGFVPKGIFKEIEGIVGQNTHQSSAMDMVNFATAAHKIVKCVIAGTRILTEKGYEKIEDAFEYKEGFKDLDINKQVYNGKEFEKVSASFSEEVEKIIRITTRDGSIIEGTEEHPIIIEENFVKLKDIKLGDKVKTFYGGPFPINNVQFSWNVWKNEPNGDSSIEMNEDYAELIGWILGDGNIFNGAAKITIGYKDVEYSCKRLSELCNRIGLPYSIYTEKKIRERANGKLTTFSIYNARFINFLSYLGLKIVNRKNVKVPEFIFYSPKSVVVAFIRGLLDTDGSADKDGNITFSSIHKLFINDIHLLLKWIGITSSISKKLSTYDNKPHISWEIRTASRQVKKLALDLQLFGMPRKLNRIKTYLENIKGREPNKWSNKVIKIEIINQKQRVYDITVPNTHSFIANGFYNHNTALSPSTWGQNVLGNTVFLWNAGVNSTGPEFLSTQKRAWDAIRGMQNSFRETGGLKELGDLGKLKSRIGGADISLADELNSKEVEQLIEKSSMLSTEGVHTINKLVDAAKEGSAIKMLGALYKKAKPVTKYIDKAADNYMAQDGAAKFAYYLHLRQDGLSRRGALLEVGRRLPMYNTVGDTWSTMRRSFQPWISFPVETARIMKNNMMDYPLRTAMVMQIPHFAQLGSYATMQAMGRPQSYKTIADRNKQLPQWAQKPSTIMTPFLDKNGDFRHATLDFLPYTSVMPDSTDPDAPFFQKLPIMKEPFPILSGIIYAMTGKDAWGRDIPSNSTTDKAKTALINTMGFLSPPLLDKYMLNATDPTMFYRLHQDLGKYPNQYTDKTGDPMFDFFLNSVVGMKSYASSPEQQVANENFKNRDLDAYKARLSKEASGLLKINDTQAAGDKLSDIYQILLQQYKQPDIARRKFNDFIKRFRNQNKGSKVMRGMSIEQLDRQVDMANERMAFESGSTREAYIDALRKERENRKGSSSDGLFNPLLPDKPTAPESPF